MGPEGALDVTKIRRVLTNALRASLFESVRCQLQRDVYDDIINHTFEKQPWQPEYDMRTTREGSVEICYDIITHTSVTTMAIGRKGMHNMGEC